MHPVLARYLDPQATAQLLQRSEAGEQLGPEHRHLVEAARAHRDELRDAVGSAGRHATVEAQQAVLFLAAHAALQAMREDEALAPKLEETSRKLRELGAEDEDVDSLFAQLVADEAFGGEEDVDAFDGAWFSESLGTLPRLAGLDEESVASLLTRFGAGGGGGEHLLREQASRTLLELAWAEGASPISGENVEDAVQVLHADLGDERIGEGVRVIQELLSFLEKEGLVGPIRSERLRKTAALAMMGGAGEERTRTARS